MSTNLSLLGGSLLVDVPDLITRVKAFETDVVVAAGTLVEGYGNAQSDVDVYIIYDGVKYVEAADLERNHFVRTAAGSWMPQPGDELGEIFHYLGTSGVAIQANYLLASKISQFAEEIRERYEWSCANMEDMHTIDYNMPYGNVGSKLLNGVTLQGAERFEQLFPRRLRLPYCYLAFRHNLPTYDDMKDIAGNWVAGRLDDCVRLMEGTRDRTAMALCHLRLLTNQNQKWLSHLLHSLPEDDEDLVSLYFDLYGRARATEQEKRAFVLDSLDWIDLFFRRVQVVSNAQAGFPSTALMGEQITRAYQPHLNRHPQFRFDFEYRKRLFQDDFKPSRWFLEALQ
jgi:hypothetical protein